MLYLRNNHGFHPLQLIVIVGDVNDNPPLCPLLSTVHVLNDTQPNTVIATVRATDADIGAYGKITYELLSNIAQEENFLAINTETGEVFTIA